MNVEFYRHPTRGLCLLISDFNRNDLHNLVGPKITNPLIHDPASIASYIKTGEKIRAIKELRQQSGWGLKEAKEYLDNYIPHTNYGNPNDNFDYSKSADIFIQDHIAEDFLGNDDFKV